MKGLSKKALVVILMAIALILPIVIGLIVGLFNANQVPNVETLQGEEEGVPNLALSENELTFSMGAQRTINATMDEDDGKYILQWKSSDESIVSVKKDADNQSSCVITGIEKGNAVVTLSVIDISKFKVIDSISCNITVMSNTITFSQDEVVISLDQGNTASVTAEAPGGGKISWFSEDESIATVTEGLITAHKTGQVYIIAKSESVESKLLVKIYNSMFTLEELHITSVGANADQIKVNGTIDGKATWTSENETIATVDNNGKVTGKKAGMTTITATSDTDGLSSTCVVIVRSGAGDPADITEGKKAAAANNSGNWYYLCENMDTVQVSFIPTIDNSLIHIDITAIGTSGANFFYLRYQPDNVGDVIYKNITYIYSNVDDAHVQINGKDYYLKSGLNVIELEYTSSAPKEGNPYQFKWRSKGEFYIIPVFEEISRIEKMTLSSESIVLNIDNNKVSTLTATVPNQKAPYVEWVSSNENVATVVNGVVTAVGEGYATITATSGSLSATCRVTVEGSTVIEGEELKSGNKTSTLNSPGEWFYFKDGKSSLFFTPIMEKDGDINLGVESIDTESKKYVYLRYQPETTEKEYKAIISIEFVGVDGTSIGVSAGNASEAAMLLKNGINTFEFTFTANNTAPLQLKFYGVGSYIVNVNLSES